MQYILKPYHHFFCITFALKGKIQLLKNDVCFVLLFHSYERAYCIHATMYLPKSIIYIHFYFIESCLFFSLPINLCILSLGHAKLQTNYKTQLTASFPWGMQNCKQKQKTKTKNTKKNKKN